MRWSGNQTYSQLVGFDAIPDMKGDLDIRPSEQEIKFSCSDGLFYRHLYPVLCSVGTRICCSVSLWYKLSGTMVLLWDHKPLEGSGRFFIDTP